MNINYNVISSEIDKLFRDSGNLISSEGDIKSANQSDVSKSASKNVSNVSSGDLYSGERVRNLLRIRKNAEGLNINPNHIGDLNADSDNQFKLERMGRMYSSIRNLRNRININNHDTKDLNKNKSLVSKSISDVVFQGDCLGVDGTVGFIVRHNLSKSDFAKFIPGWSVIALNSASLRYLGSNVLNGYISVEGGKFTSNKFVQSSKSTQSVKSEKSDKSSVNGRMFFVYSQIQLGSLINNPSKVTEFVGRFDNVLPALSDKSYVLFGGEWISKPGLSYWIELIRGIESHSVSVSTPIRNGNIDNNVDSSHVVNSMLMNLLRLQMVQGVISVNLSLRIQLIRCQSALSVSSTQSN